MPTGHYDRHPGLNDGLGDHERRCSKCKEVKPLNGFSPDRRLRPDGLQATCKACRKAAQKAWREANPDEAKRRERARYLKDRPRRDAYGLKWRQKNRHRVRHYALKGRYGLSGAEHAAMLLAQGNRCAICEKPFTKRHHTDHNHTTGAVRGILCGGCNIALGFIEKPGFLDAALAYLEHHGATHSGPSLSGPKATLSSA